MIPQQTLISACSFAYLTSIIAKPQAVIRDYLKMFIANHCIVGQNSGVGAVTDTRCFDFGCSNSIARRTTSYDDIAIASSSYRRSHRTPIDYTPAAAANNRPPLLLPRLDARAGRHSRESGSPGVAALPRTGHSRSTGGPEGSGSSDTWIACGRSTARSAGTVCSDPECRWMME